LAAKVTENRTNILETFAYCHPKSGEFCRESTVAKRLGHRWLTHSKYIRLGQVSLLDREKEAALILKSPIVLVHGC
jgi:hypothetical protein